MPDPGELAVRWWETLADRCLRGERVKPARNRGRRVNLWPLTQVAHAGAMVEPLLEGERRGVHAEQVNDIVRGFGWYRSGEAWGPRHGERPRYADDVAWLGLALAALADVRGEPTSADASRALDFARSCEHLDGGIRWHEDAASRHTCSTAPAAHLALRIHRNDGDTDAIAFARRSMTWLDVTLRGENGLYGDHVGDVIDPTVWAYNQGEAAAAWSMLAIVGDAEAADALGQTLAAAVPWLGDAAVLWAQPQVFVGIGVRSLVPLDTTGTLRTAVLDHLGRVAADGLDDDGFPIEHGPGRYGDDVAIDLAGLIQMAATCAGPLDLPR